MANLPRRCAHQKRGIKCFSLNFHLNMLLIDEHDCVQFKVHYERQDSRDDKSPTQEMSILMTAVQILRKAVLSSD
jgi:hypothetical protein